MAVGFVRHGLDLLWVHGFLKKIARKDADFFARFIGEYCDNDKQLKIMLLRYVHRFKFKQIPELVFVEERQVYRLHQQVIDRIINK